MRTYQTMERAALFPVRPIALAAFAGLLTTAAYADTRGHCAAAWKARHPLRPPPDRTVHGQRHALRKATWFPTEASTMNPVLAEATDFLMGVSADYTMLAKLMEHMADPIPASEDFKL